MRAPRDAKQVIVQHEWNILPATLKGTLPFINSVVITSAWSRSDNGGNIYSVLCCACKKKKTQKKPTTKNWLLKLLKCDTKNGLSV